MSQKLKFEGLAIGTKIRAYHFKPTPGRKASYLEGTICGTDMHFGAKMYAVDLTADTSDAIFHLREPAQKFGLIPMEVAGHEEYDGRIQVLD